MKDLTLWPLVRYEDKWSVPDVLLLNIWEGLIDNKRHEMLFYDGTVKTGWEWLQYTKSPHQFVTFVVNEKEREFIGMGWLSNIQQGTAEAHFCFFKKYISGAGEMVIGFWNERMSLNLIYGYTPESYTTVLKLLKKWGFKQLGIMPNYCNMVYKNTREGAMISYRLMEDANVQA